MTARKCTAKICYIYVEWFLVIIIIITGVEKRSIGLKMAFPKYRINSFKYWNEISLYAMEFTLEQMILHNKIPILLDILKIQHLFHPIRCPKMNANFQ